MRNAILSIMLITNAFGNFGGVWTLDDKFQESDVVIIGKVNEVKVQQSLIHIKVKVKNQYKENVSSIIPVTVNQKYKDKVEDASKRLHLMFLKSTGDTFTFIDVGAHSNLIEISEDSEEIVRDAMSLLNQSTGTPTNLIKLSLSLIADHNFRPIASETIIQTIENESLPKDIIRTILNHLKQENMIEDNEFKQESLFTLKRIFRNINQSSDSVEHVDFSTTSGNREDPFLGMKNATLME